MNKHNLKGNCWDKEAIYPDPNSDLNDICEEHDEPRGSCSICPRCVVCDNELSELSAPKDIK